MLSANSFERLPKQGCPLLSTIQILFCIEQMYYSAFSGFFIILNFICQHTIVYKANAAKSLSKQDLLFCVWIYPEFVCLVCHNFTSFLCLSALGFRYISLSLQSVLHLL